MKKDKVRSKKALKVSALGVVLALIAVGCSGGSKDDVGQVFRYTLRDDMKTMDPANAYDSMSLEVLPNIAESLYQYDLTKTEYTAIPLLASDMPSYSKDRLTVKIPIKRGVLFQDDKAFPNGKGRELKAQDFVYAIKRLADPSIESQGSWIFEGKLLGFEAFQNKIREAPKAEQKKIFEETELPGIRALDDYTFELKLTKPYPQLIHALTMTFVSPVAKEIIDAYADERRQLNDKWVGTGPFRLAKWDRGHEVVIEKNPTFRGDAFPAGMGLDVGKPTPFLDKIVFKVTKEEQPAWLNFLKGELDFSKIPKDNFSSAFAAGMKISDEMAKKGIRLEKIDGGVFYYINFNVKDPVLKNKYLRQAISSAIDRDQWITLFFNGRGAKQVTAAPPGLPDRPKDSKIKYDFDLNRAKELMKKAGYPDGKGLAPITFDMRGADSVNRQLGEFFTAQMAKIGVKLNVVYNTFPAFLEKKQKGQLGMSYGGWIIDYPDVENVYTLLYPSKTAPIPNDCFFDHAEYNKAYEKMAIMDVGPARAKLVKQMDDIIQEEVPWALGFYRDDYVLVQGWVQNFRASFFGRDTYKYYRIDQEKKKEILASLRKK